MKEKITRRQFVRTAGLGALALFTPYILTPHKSPFSLSGQLDLAPFQFNPHYPPEDVFGLSIASGDPTPAGVILWTRINNDQWVPDSQLAFQAALDPAFTQIVAQGLINSADFGPDRDYTVKIDLDGALAPNIRYHYRFIYAQTASRVGRCRTLPHPDSSPHQARFAVLTCQNYTNGYYNAYHHLAQEDVDFIIHLGDFIYEYVVDPYPQALIIPERIITLPGRGSVALNLEDYRHIYRTYRSDSSFQEAMEQHTFINIWDDHEMANDCYWDYALDAPGAPDHPYAGDPQALTQLKLDAQRAWAEYVPARPQIDPNATHPHDFLSIWRPFRFGNLLELFMSDGRTYRSPHPCGEETIGGRYVSPGCEAQQDPNRSMLGLEQRDWLLNGLLNSNALWKVWGNQVLQVPLRIPRQNQPGEYIYLNLDAWDGYEYERTYVMQQLRDAGIQNFVVLTGDLHAYMASYLKVDYEQKANVGPNVVGVEFMTPAITSANVCEVLADLGIPFCVPEGLVKLLNWHVDFFNGEDWGYAVVAFNRFRCDYTAYKVDKSQDNPDVPKETIKRLRVRKDKKRIIDLERRKGSPIRRLLSSEKNFP